MPTRSLKPHRGSKKGLVVCIDIGTTYTGVSYAFLEPGKSPEIKTVYGWTDFKKQEGNYKIPTVVYYGQDGKPCGFGYMKENEVTESESEQDDGFVDVTNKEGYPYVARWFKLRLCPGDVKLPADIARTLPPLPPGKTVIDVLGDFLRYVYDYTRTYLQEKDVANGRSIWAQVEKNIVFVLTHPNGWRGKSQTRMRRAAVLGGLVPNMDEALKRVNFVTEGEANLHYCLYHEMVGGTSENPEANTLLVVDAGGGTVDLSTYTITSNSPLTVEETTIPECILEGSTMVTRRLEVKLSKRFTGSEYGSEENIRDMMLKFDAEDKPRFSSDLKRGVKIDFHVHSRDDKALGLRKGRPHVSSEEMKTCFKPAFDGILSSIENQFSLAKSAITTVFFLGGFSANDWLFYELEKAVKDKHKLELHRPDSQLCKEVAEGGVAFLLERFVTHRYVENTYGTPVSMHFNPFDSEHLERIESAIHTPVGLMLNGGFSAIMSKWSLVEDGEEFSENFTKAVTQGFQEKLDLVSEDILTYEGKQLRPRWMDEERDSFKRICVVRADLSGCKATCEEDGPVKMYKKEFCIVFKYSTELTAQIEWEENGKPQRGPAQVIHDF